MWVEVIQGGMVAKPTIKAHHVTEDFVLSVLQRVEHPICAFTLKRCPQDVHLGVIKAIACATYTNRDSTPLKVE